MQAIMKKFKKEEKGFTLIELLAVIVILAVIAVIAVPLIGNIIGDSKTKADLATARQIYDAARLHATAENNGTLIDVTVSDLQLANYLDSPISLPSTKAVISGTSKIDVSEASGDYLVIYVGNDTTVGKKYTKAQLLSGQ